MSNTSSQFTIPADGYLTFDSATMRQFIKDRLNETGVFTDQNYQGSYISTVNEIIAYTFHILMYYLNRTSTEGQFSEAQLYENMNRIVKLLDYKPIGKQTSTLSFGMTAGPTFDVGLYTIPRYSYIENSTQTYSFNNDTTFTKSVSVGTLQSVDAAVNQDLLYEGHYREYPIYTAVGSDNEVVLLAPGNNVLVDHFNIDVYVNSGGNWAAWKKVTSLYLEDAFSQSYEIRLNENLQYELKFGNDINGKKLLTNDQVAIYYLESDGKTGEVGISTIAGKNLVPFSTLQFTTILSSINAQNSNQISYITTSQASDLAFNNTTISTYYQAEESVDSVRNNAPGVYRSQYRLITEQDYENFVKTNFANLIHDVRVVDNLTYISNQLKYYYDIGLSNPNSVSNILYNQVNFADACNFNNVYVTVVPKTISNASNPISNLTPAQKELIISNIRSVKTLTSETVILDPVYIAVDIALPLAGTTASQDDIANTQLFIIKSANALRSDSSIISDVAAVFTSYFNRSNRNLGDTIDIAALTNQILSVNGVSTFYTQRTDNPAIQYQGLAMLVWNPVYPNDMTLTTKNISMSYFKYLYLNNSSSFSGRIAIGTNTKTYESVEF